MNDDSTERNPAPNSEESAAEGEIDKRPHALDDAYDDWSPPSKSFITLRNGLALALTFFTSTILALGIGLPSSLGAMIGVWVATTALFGPLWFALFNQNFAERFQKPNRESVDSVDSNEAEASGAGSVEPSTGAPSTGASSTGASSTLGDMVSALNATRDSASPSREPLPSYYQPMQRREFQNGVNISAAGYAIIIVFSGFIGLLVIGSPFLAAAIIWAFG